MNILSTKKTIPYLFLGLAILLFNIVVASQAHAQQITSPVPGSTLSGTSVTFNWTSGAYQYVLYVGSSQGQKDIFFVNAAGTVTSAPVSNLPDNGSTVYVRFYYRSSAGADWAYTDYTYKAWSPNPSPPPPSSQQITSPVPGSTLSGTSVTFNWTSGAYQYVLYVGSSQGQKDIFFVNAAGTVTSAPVSNLPDNGSTVYVRFYYRSSAGADWAYTDYTYKAWSPEKRQGKYYYVTEYETLGGGAQQHQIYLFFDKDSNALVVEIRANYQVNWTDMIKSGSLKVRIPDGLNMDWGKIGVYVSRSITPTDINSLAYPNTSCFYELLSEKFNVQNIGSSNPTNEQLFDFSVGWAFDLFDIAFDAQAGVVFNTWQSLSTFLKGRYSNYDWIGDGQELPEFIPSQKDAAGNQYGNTGKVHVFTWIPPSFWQSLNIEAGYQVVTVKIPFLNWGCQSQVQLYGQIQVHTAFNKPSVTLFSRRFNGTDTGCH